MVNESAMWPVLSINEVLTVFVGENAQQTQCCSFLNEMSCYSLGGCRGNIPCLSAYRSYQITVYWCLWFSATYITEDAGPKIVDAHFHDAAGSMPLFLWLTKVAHTPFITVCNLSQLWLPKMQNQKLLTLRWRSFSSWGREHVAFSLSYKGGQYSIYDGLQPFTTLITNDAKPKIIDTLLMLISMYCLVKICWQQ